MSTVFGLVARRCLFSLIVFATLSTPARSERRDSGQGEGCALAILWVVIGVPVYLSGLGGYLCDSTASCVRATVAYFTPHPTTVIERPTTIIVNPSHSVISGQTGEIHFDVNEDGGRSQRRAYRLVPVPEGQESDGSTFYLDGPSSH